MWSGLLPPGLNESDVDSSSENEEESFQLPELQESGPESNAITKPVLISVADGENASETCPAGIPLNIWNVGIVAWLQILLTYLNSCFFKFKQLKFRYFSSQQLANEDHWKELTQYFGINDRFESPVDSRAPQKVIVVTKAVPSFF
uniref:Uncharacterized protein n=1 Tax=Pavo cristatus TaxID=9049 RepID=A0A8C9FRV0_PAVCR